MNIIGEGLAPYVKQQIEVRQQIYGSLNRTPEELLYLDNRSGFVRAVSGVNIGPTFIPASSDLKNITDQYGSDKLARNFILFGGATNESRVLKAGIPAQLLGTDYVNNLAYGFGGLEFGIRPMPGILSMTNKSEGMGSLETTTLRIKAWNRIQLEIIDLLYLRLGYGVLVEWGNSNYFDNKSNYQPDNLNTIYTKFLNADYSVQELLDAIETTKRESSGNYDAIYGKVVNFSWEFVNDGSYDITVILRSVGDVVEAFQTAVYLTDKDTSSPIENTKTSEQAFNEQQNAQVTAAQDNTNVQLPGLTPTDIAFVQQSLAETPATEEQIRAAEEIPAIDDNSNTHVLGKLFYDVMQKFGVGGTGIEENTNYQSAKYQPSGDQYITYIRQAFQGNTEENVSKTKSDQYYIRFGSLLAYFKENIFPQYKKGQNFTPVLEVDYTTRTNLAYTTPVQVSSNPKICMVNVDVPSSNGTSKFVFAPLGEKYQTTIAGTQVGQIMNIYINFNHIINIIDGNGDPKNQTTLIKFFEVLCNDLSVALGSINTFRPFIDKTTNTFKIIDEAKIPNKNDILKALGKPSPLTDPELKIYGYDFPRNIVETSLASFVREFKLVTQIPPNFATIITTGAQAAGAVVGEDATALSRLNRGLEDRIKPEVINASSVTKPENKTQPVEEKFPDASKNFYEFISKIGINPADPPGQDIITKGPFLIDGQLYSYTNFAATYYEYLESKAAIEQGTASGTMGFIPVGVGLTLDGISGMKIYNALKVETRYLPANYPDTMEFIITGLSHTVENNVWTTELKTIMQPTIIADVKAIVPEFTETENAPQTTCGEPALNTNVQGTNAPSDNRRLNAMKASYDAVFFGSRKNGESSFCARYTYNLASKYIDSLLRNKAIDQDIITGKGDANTTDYFSNLSSLGYTQIILGENLTKEQAIALINGLQYNIGDVVSYKASLTGGAGTPERSFIYGHTQIYVGTGIIPSGWASSKPANYDKSFVYNTKPYTCYKIILHRAPDILGRTQSGSPSPQPTPTLNPGTAAVLSQFAQQQNQ
jgi:hypothetical protein